MQLTKLQLVEYCAKTVYNVPLDKPLTNKYRNIKKHVNTLMTYRKEYLEDMYKIALRIQTNKG